MTKFDIKPTSSETRIHCEMNIVWILISLIVSLSEASPSANSRFKPTFKCFGLLCNVKHSSTDPTAAAKAQTASGTIRPRTIAPSKVGAKETDPCGVKERRTSFIGSFFKLVTQGLLKKVALPAIVRMSMRAEESERAKRAGKLIKITRAQ